MATMSIANSATMMSTFFNLSEIAVASMPKDPALLFSISFQPMTKNMIRIGAGSNSLGLSEEDGDLILINLTAMWADAANDDAINAVAKNLFDQGETAAQELGVYQRYKYLNFAAFWQDPIADYGPEANRELRATRTRYDPDGMFTKQVPGGHKLK